MHETGLQEASIVREPIPSEDTASVVLQPPVCGIDEAPSTRAAFQVQEKEKMGTPPVAHVDVSSLSADTRITNSSVTRMETDILQSEVREPSEEDRAASAIAAADSIVFENLQEITRSVVARALAGNMDAVRELRVGHVEPHRVKVSRRATPKLSAIIIDALSRLPVKYTPPVDAIDAEVVETPAPSDNPPKT